MSVEIVDPARTYELRRSLLRPWVDSGDPLPGHDPEGAVHFGRLVDGQVVSTCLVAPAPCPWRPDVRGAWQLRAMATHPEHRGHGYAGEIVDAAVAYVRERGGTVLWCNARELAVPMYERHGFAVDSELYLDEHGIPHKHMSIVTDGSS